MRLLPLPGVFQPPSDSWLLIRQLRSEPLPPGATGLDLCTGSGVLAIAAAQRGCRTVTAVDISRRAVLSAGLNARLNGVPVRPVRGDLFGPVQGWKFDLIVSNPPYVPSPDGGLPRRGAARAWEGGSDGRSFVDRICAQAAWYLRPGGVLLLVHSAVCGERATLEALEAHGLQAHVALRHRGPLGPILRGRRQWLAEQELLEDADEEEMLVVRACV